MGRTGEKVALSGVTHTKKDHAHVPSHVDPASLCFSFLGVYPRAQVEDSKLERFPLCEEAP